MHKIMFNDRYGLTQAVIEGRKTMTRRIIPREFFTLQWDVSGEKDLVFENADGDMVDIRRSRYTKYKVGEVVAVAQRYEDVEELSYLLRDPFSETYFEEVNIGDEPGYRNKMFVKAELMPHQIRITGIRCELLQDITDEDCMKEGIREDPFPIENPYYFGDAKEGGLVHLGTPREAFASLIDRVSGKGTWASNPWVVVYEFELVK
jgi:hypothetical protein